MASTEPLPATLRIATPADADRIGDIFLASRAAFLTYAPLPYSDDQVRAWVRDVLLPSEHVTVALVAERPIGFIATRQDGRTSWITQLYIDPVHVAHGIGAALLLTALQRLPHPVRLHAFVQNFGARRFYERHGFFPILFTDGQANDERCPDVLYERAP